MAVKIETQLATIEHLLQQILKNTEPEVEDEDQPCPTCGHMSDGGPKGKMLIVMSKKKGTPEEMPEMPEMVKDLLKTLSHS